MRNTPLALEKYCHLQFFCTLYINFPNQPNPNSPTAYPLAVESDLANTSPAVRRLRGSELSSQWIVRIVCWYFALDYVPREKLKVSRRGTGEVVDLAVHIKFHSTMVWLFSRRYGVTQALVSAKLNESSM